MCVVGLMAATMVGAGAPPSTAVPRYFRIQVLDGETARGVPLVELRTVNEATWWTDSNGIIAFEEPGLMGMEVFFHVASPGYEIAGDGFGYHGVKLRPVPGGSATITIARRNIAQRLYRVTGEGIYRDSVLTGQAAPILHPVLNGQVMGQDTVVATRYHDRIYWFWGDTERPSYPLGHFAVSGATSELPGRGGLDPAVGINLAYFVDANGFSRPMCPTPDFGMRWLEGVFTVRDPQGREKLVSRLAVMKNLGEAHEWHLVVFNDAAGAFESIQRWDFHEPHRSAHPFHAEINGQDYVYLFPDLRVKGDLAVMADLKNYEAFTCVSGDGSWRGNATVVQRDARGRLRFDWKRGAAQLIQSRLDDLIATKQLRPNECPLHFIDFETGRRLGGEATSVSWNEFRHQWIAFAADKPGEAWFATADTPMGPWSYARRVVTHGDYNFYNIAHHAFFDQQAGRLVYFEGTYTDSFSNARTRTPRYNYNQLMYRLDLADARLRLPIAIYTLRDTAGVRRLARRDEIVATDSWSRVEEVAFFALPPDCTRAGTLPVFAVQQDDGTELSLAPHDAAAKPFFVALPMTLPARDKGLTGTWQCQAQKNGEPGDGASFELEITAGVEGLSAKFEDGKPAGRGAIQDRHFTLRLEHDGFFDCAAVLTEDSFVGTWQRQNGEEHGTWSGKRMHQGPVEWSSSSIVGLRADTAPATKARSYKTEALPSTGVATAGDLCRVWKAPTRTVIFDADVQRSAR